MTVDLETPHWVNSLQRLRKRFCDAADFYQLHRGGKSLTLVLIHWPKKDLEGKWRNECFNHVSKTVGDRLPPNAGTGDALLNCVRKFGTFDRQSSRYLMSSLVGDSPLLDPLVGDSLWNQWDSLMHDAGLAIWHSPRLVRERFRLQLEHVHLDAQGRPFDEITDEAENAWIWCLFQFAWSVPLGAQLHADRRLYIPGFTDVSYDLESVNQVAKYLPSDRASWKCELPDAYYAILHDAYNSSVCFIDWLITEVSLKDSRTREEPSKLSIPIASDPEPDVDGPFGNSKLKLGSNIYHFKKGTRSWRLLQAFWNVQLDHALPVAHLVGPNLAWESEPDESNITSSLNRFKNDMPCELSWCLSKSGWDISKVAKSR